MRVARGIIILKTGTYYVISNLVSEMFSDGDSVTADRPSGGRVKVFTENVDAIELYSDSHAHMEHFRYRLRNLAADESKTQAT